MASAVCALLEATGRCDARKVLRSLEWRDAGRRDAQIGRRHVCLASGRKNHERRKKKRFRNFTTFSTNPTLYPAWLVQLKASYRYPEELAQEIH